MERCQAPTRCLLGEGQRPKGRNGRQHLGSSWSTGPGTQRRTTEIALGSVRINSGEGEEMLSLETSHRDPEGSTPSRQRPASQPEASLACGSGEIIAVLQRVR